MATIQSEFGKIFRIEDFLGGEDIIANTAVSRQFGTAGFRVIGQGSEEADSGITSLETDPNLNGVGVFTTTNEADHSLGICTSKMFDVTLNGGFVAECRVQFADLDYKQFYFGFTDHNDDTAILEGETILGSSTTLTLSASDLCGFLYSAELTEDEMWHMPYNGGTTAGETDSTEVESGVDAVAGEWDILRIEVDPNGTARWYVNGVLKQTQAGAVSLTTDLALLAMVECKDTAAIEYAKVDYVAYRFNRDWTK